MGSAVGLVKGEGSVVAGRVICGLHDLFAQCALMEQAVTERLDLRQRTWEIRKGIWPTRRREQGELNEASRMVVAGESSMDEGAEYEVLVAGLEWRDGWQAPFVLAERPNNVDGIR
jgi:hypothetical protein